MTQIKIVGDIWSGKFQPALTGNRIVDTALLTQFCSKLADWLSGQNIKLPVKIEHDFCLETAVSDGTLYLIDSNILNAFPKDALRRINFLTIKHQNFLHGDPMDICQSVLARLKTGLKLQQTKRG
ncbi:hypothetical protein HC026_09760 [Lactobacillus sp. LC28-10]|uniref:Uncharacterized protein n=1 Tax=Secundilactobacillus angelensis TaxID=2722706 RepID=A0ABX1KZ28_9LACO|nr:hypothetical protein [Secundilactobacillus angelensis]MCH5463269.1 hypothetical protein [Secundilactobacillus angelensis]NLR19197.1 hypothetical protein [Secundilactobacillus angelensis]